MLPATEDVIPLVDREVGQTVCPDDRGRARGNAGRVDITLIVEVVRVVLGTVCGLEEFRGEVQPLVAETSVARWKDGLVVAEGDVQRQLHAGFGFGGFGGAGLGVTGLPEAIRRLVLMLFEETDALGAVGFES